MTCPDCAYWRREAAQSRSAYLAAEGRIERLHARLEHLQAANEAHDHQPTGYLAGRAWPEMGAYTARTADIPSTARRAAEEAQ